MCIPCGHFHIANFLNSHLKGRGHRPGLMAVGYEIMDIFRTLTCQYLPCSDPEDTQHSG